MIYTVDRYCLDLFPELSVLNSIEALEEASALGTYIFHEDIFLPFVTTFSVNADFLKRVASYLEYLASDQNPHLHNLASIGLLEGLIDHKFEVIAPYLGENTKLLMLNRNFGAKFDPNVWVSGNKYY